ncbi:MAG: hypothetical protein ACI4CE_07470 [Methanomethylophilus alvi]
MSSRNKYYAICRVNHLNDGTDKLSFLANRIEDVYDTSADNAECLSATQVAAYVGDGLRTDDLCDNETSTPDWYIVPYVITRIIAHRNEKTSLYPWKDYSGSEDAGEKNGWMMAYDAETVLKWGTNCADPSVVLGAMRPVYFEGGLDVPKPATAEQRVLLECEGYLEEDTDDAKVIAEDGRGAILYRLGENDFAVEGPTGLVIANLDEWEAMVQWCP